MKAYFHTLGCKVNQYETQAMRSLLEDDGYETAEFSVGQADMGEALLVINSCTVTGESDRKLRQLLRRCRREHPQAIIVLTGCFPQAFPAEAAALPQADILLGNAARRELPARVAQFLETKQRVVAIGPHGREYESLSICEFQGRTRAFVKIEDGCDRFCSYCIIPYARGRVRSKPLQELREEVEQLAKQGYCEIVLVGINLTAYGRDIGCTICDAVETACQPTGIQRVRLGSIEPDHLDEQVIRRLAACDKLCPQFHLALQSGCDATLKRMNRHYTTDDYRRICGQLRTAFPNCALTTDVMVGFPGETEEEFESSLAFVREIGFSRVHCFSYSRRPGTPAAKAPSQVPNAVKLQRSRRMIAAGEQGRAVYETKLIGKTVAVLPETVSEDGRLEGYTDTYVPVLVSGCEIGVPAQVKIIERTDERCIGERV